MRQVLAVLSLVLLLGQGAGADPPGASEAKVRPRAARVARKAAAPAPVVEAGQAAAQARVERLEVERQRAAVGDEVRDRKAERREARGELGRARMLPEVDRFQMLKERQDLRVERREARRERAHHPVP